MGSFLSYLVFEKSLNNQFLIDLVWYDLSGVCLDDEPTLTKGVSWLGRMVGLPNPSSEESSLTSTSTSERRVHRRPLAAAEDFLFLPPFLLDMGFDDSDDNGDGVGFWCLDWRCLFDRLFEDNRFLLLLLLLLFLLLLTVFWVRLDSRFTLERFLLTSSVSLL